MPKINNWLEHLKNNPIPWLLESNPWTKYKTLTDLMDLPLSSSEVKKQNKKESSPWITFLCCRILKRRYG